MINLLPSDTKKQIHAARQNKVLLSYVILFTAVLLLTLGIFAADFYITINDKNAALALQAEESAKAKAYDKTRTQAEAFAKDLKAAKSILTNEVSYSKLLIDIANVVPKRTIISSLNLAANSFGTPVTLTARAITYKDALKLKDSLEDSKLFEKVSLTSTSTDTPASEEEGENSENTLASRYPINITLNATLSKPAGSVNSEVAQ